METGMQAAQRGHIRTVNHMYVRAQTRHDVLIVCIVPNNQAVGAGSRSLLSVQQETIY